jgi:hypothetical protein
VGELVGELVGGGHGSGEHDGDPLDVGDAVGVVGADDVGSLVVGALDVGADDLVCRVVGGGGGGVYGAWPVSGGFPVTYAGGGKFCTGTPSRSAFITADQVAVG